MLRHFVFLAFFLCLFVVVDKVVASEEGAQFYALPAVFVSGHALQEGHFIKAISSDGMGRDRNYAIERFGEVFSNHFKDVAITIDSQNKYRTFVVYLQIPRVSKYAVQKTEHLQDLYMPMTMTLGFANMVTGEVLYTHTYTHYAKYGTTVDADASQELEVVKLYRETFDELLEQVVSSARVNFNPKAIQATVRGDWKGLFILDKGTRSGVVRGDILAAGEGQILSIVHAEEEFAIGQSIMGKPKNGNVFEKYSNEDIADIKKPKIMLLKNSVNNEDHVLIDREDLIYQLFINALGKRATFSLLSLDKSFYDVQRAVVETTKLEQKVTQQRELPDYFLSLYIHGPFFKSLPTNKPDVTVDEYSVRACGDFLDAGGKVVYGKCVEEVISDQIVAGIRFPRSSREEIVIKNSLLKLADDFIQNVKFTSFTLPVVSSDKLNGITIQDKAGALSNGLVVTSYHSIGEVSDVKGKVRLPTEILQVSDVSKSPPLAFSLMKFSEELPPSTVGDVVLLDAILGGEGGIQKSVKLCAPPTAKAYSEEVLRIFYYAVIEGITYPFYEIRPLQNALKSLPEYGFREWRGVLNEDADYCVEPVIKINSENINKMVNCSLVAGIKLHQGEDVVWKKGMQQEWSFSLPEGSDSKCITSEVCRVMYPLVTELSGEIEIK